MLTSGTSSRKRAVLIPAFLAAFLLVLTATTFTLYRRARTHLDNELGERLKSVATSLGHLVEVIAPDSTALELPGQDVYNRLYLAREENTLRNVVILSPSGHTIVDLQGATDPGAPNPFIDLDYSAFTLARSGIAAPTSLYRVGDDYLKSAYAPVTSAAGDVVAILGVDADAEFFAQLRELTTVIVVITALGVTVVIVLGFLFYAQSRSLDRAEAAVVQKENLATMGRMVANIAHEIRNPLSVIRTSSERLRRKYHDEEEAFSFISEEVDELNRILTGYLQFAHTGKAEFGSQPGRKIISRCVMAVGEDVERKSLSIVENLPGEEVMIHGDEKRLRQAVLNVLINAVQAANTRGRIDVSLASSGRDAIITISDNGHGIDDKDLGEVTKPFYTRKVDGSGLGLSIVQSIVDEHKGSLDIQSRSGDGTRVTMTFPLAAARQGRSDG
jgi:signal transduction histidine kinase